MRHKLSLIALPTAVMLLVGWFSPALTATAVTSDLNITTNGPLYFMIKPGQTSTQTIRIENHNLSTENLAISLEKFYIPQGQTAPTIAPRSDNDTYFDWVKFSRTTIAAAPNVWNSVDMTLTVPAHVSDFGYYYAVVIQRATAPTPVPGKNLITSKVVDFVLLGIDDPGAIKAIQVEQFYADHRFYEYLPANFTVLVKNTGNTYTAPLGNIFIYKGDGNLPNQKPIDILTVNGNKGAIITGSLRSFVGTWTDGFPLYVPKMANGSPVVAKNGQAESKLNWDFSQSSKFRIGKYTAKLTLIYFDGKEDVPLNAAVSFWIFPWRLIGLIVIILVFAPIGFYFTVNKLMGRMRRRRRK